MPHPLDPGVLAVDLDRSQEGASCLMSQSPKQTLAQPSLLCPTPLLLGNLRQVGENMCVPVAGIGAGGLFF